MRSQSSPAERFWVKVDKSGDCWLWTGRPLPNGYGQITINGKMWLAHRLAWTLTNGPIPSGMQVCHDCPTGDNPLCVRHLFLGTQQDNIRDMYSKGRGFVGAAHYSRTQPERLSRGDQHYTRLRPDSVPRGEQHGMAILTEDAVREIRRLYAEGGVTQTQLASAFGTTQTNVSLIVRRRIWVHAL